MKKEVSVLFRFILIFFVVSGCRMTLGDKLYTGSIMVKDHPNAEIYFDGYKIGKWTAIGLFPRDRPLTIEVREDGCESMIQTFDRRLNKRDFILYAFDGGIGWGRSLEPDYKHNPAIQKIMDSSFSFMVDYSGCANNGKQPGEN